MRGMLRTLRNGSRALLRSPGFAAAAILTLALGIGATSSVFTVAWTILARPLPYAGAEELVAVFTTEPQLAARRNPTSPANFLDLAARSETLVEWTAARVWSPTLEGGGPAVQVPALMATPGLFELLGAHTAVGAPFRADGPPADDKVVVLSHGLWERRFGSDPALVGTRVRLDGEPFTVLGVAPPGFRFPPFWATDAELWVPLVFSPDDAASRRAAYLRVFARLAPGRSLDEARAELEGLMAGLVAAHPDANRHLGVHVEPLREPVVGASRQPLAILLTAVGLVLLTACANVAGLFLARSADREGELALRSALGARRRDLLGVVLAESGCIAAAGGAVGWLLASAAIEAVRTLGPADLPRLHELELGATVLVFTVGVSCLAALGAGLLPALRATRQDPDAALRRTGRTVAAGPHRLWRPLVVTQVSLAMLLLAGAALLLRTLLSLVTLDPGFQVERVLTADLPLGASAHADAERQPLYFERVVEAVAALPGVESAALVNHLPIGGDVWRGDLEIGGVPELDPPPKAVLRVVSPGYFSTVGIPLLSGRAFDATDRPDGPPTAVINETLAKLLPVAAGGRLRFAGSAPGEPWIEVVGVVGDARQERLQAPVEPEVYFPYAQNPYPWFRQTTVVARTAVPPPDLVPAVQEAVWSVDPAVPVVRPRSLAQVLAADLTAARSLAMLLGTFAAAALALAAVGLYGLLGFLVVRRRREIGVRMSLGASRRQVLRLVLAQGGTLAAAGVVLGLTAAYAATGLLEGLLYGVRANDGASLAAAAGLLLAVALAASYLPARRATRVDPAETLRGG